MKYRVTMDTTICLTFEAKSEEDAKALAETLSYANADGFSFIGPGIGSELDARMYFDTTVDIYDSWDGDIQTKDGR